MRRSKTSRDIKRIEFPSKNMLNTTLVTHIELIEDGKSKYFNWSHNNKVYAMLEDNHKVLKIIVNTK
jgi:hypothetical protein